MAPKDWEDEGSDSSTPPSSPPPPTRRGKFDDEEEDSDVVDSWEAADDSEAEREKVKKATEAQAKAEAEAKAKHKSKAERVAARKEENLRRKLAQAGESSDEDEDEDERRARVLREQKEADLRHAEDLFGDLNIAGEKRAASKPVTLQTSSDDPTNVIDLAALPVFNPKTKDQFAKLRDTLVPLLSANAKKAQYSLFMQEFAKQICRELPSDQIKKIASGLTTLSNEKMKEEKAAEKGGKKSKAAKTKNSLVATRDLSYKADTGIYDDDGLDDGDFM